MKNNWIVSAVDYLTALLVVITWGVTFALTRTLLASFSAFEIWVIRYLLALAILWPMERYAAKSNAHNLPP